MWKPDLYIKIKQMQLKLVRLYICRDIRVTVLQDDVVYLTWTWFRSSIMKTFKQEHWWLTGRICLHHSSSPDPYSQLKSDVWVLLSLLSDETRSFTLRQALDLINLIAFTRVSLRFSFCSLLLYCSFMMEIVVRSDKLCLIYVNKSALDLRYLFLLSMRWVCLIYNNTHTVIL